MIEENGQTVDTLNTLQRTPRNTKLGKAKKFITRTHVLQLLAQHKGELAKRFGVINLALFGSTAHDISRPDSDVDVLIAFEGPATSARYFGVQFYLEDLLGCSVDLVTDKALRPELRPYVEKEAIYV